MVNLLHCMDQWGRTIILQDARWNQHILRQHPELADYLEHIRETVTSPHVVTLDAKWEQGENYYRAFALPPPYNRLYLKVCVHFNEDNPATGRVITAYPTERIKSSEGHKWSILTS